MTFKDRLRYRNLLSFDILDLVNYCIDEYQIDEVEAADLVADAAVSYYQKLISRRRSE